MKTSGSDVGTILVVDDSEETISMLRTILGEEGYTVSVATNGEKALNRVRQITPDLILLDIMMPVMDGFEVCNLLKADSTYRDIPVIFLSGLTDTIDKVKAFDNGGVDYLIKPVAPQELIARVRTHLSISRLENELHHANQSLEERVQERTRDLTRAYAELQEEIAQREVMQESLRRATMKLNLLNTITYTDIKNSVFTLSGYLALEKEFPRNEQTEKFLDHEINLTNSILDSISFSQHYQNLGTKPPEWQILLQVFLYGISHVNLMTISRDLDIDGVEIFADPLLEHVFTILAENVLLHSGATRLHLWYQQELEGVEIFFEDNGVGISPECKESIFENRRDNKRGMSLFLVREILSLTNITIHEDGVFGSGARFRLTVPKSKVRLTIQP
ncbi:MAG TPA: response regulator [Methanospirillum sp.]|nr:response regulator [Methanospirillum sp.]